MVFKIKKIIICCIFPDYRSVYFYSYYDKSQSSEIRIWDSLIIFSPLIVMTSPEGVY